MIRQLFSCPTRNHKHLPPTINVILLEYFTSFWQTLIPKKVYFGIKWTLFFNCFGALHWFKLGNSDMCSFLQPSFQLDWLALVIRKDQMIILLINFKYLVHILKQFFTWTTREEFYLVLLGVEMQYDNLLTLEAFIKILRPCGIDVMFQIHF